MILYHVSRELDLKPFFHPRVPSKDRMLKCENSTIPRLCVSTTLEGALSAIPRDYEDICDIPFRIYEFNSDNHFVIPYSVLYEKEEVIDANITKECWILDDTIVPHKTYIIDIESYNSEADDAIPYTRRDEYYNLVKDDEDNWEFYLEKVEGFFMSFYKKVKYKVRRD